MKVIHRDIKPDNILVGDSGQIVLGDFGVTCEMIECGDRYRYRKTLTGSPCFMAPEIFENEYGYNEKVDVWALGITALFLAYGKTPYGHFPPIKIMLELMKNDAPDLNSFNDKTHEWSDSFHNFVSKCLRKDQIKRYSSKKLLAHKFLKQAKTQQYIYDNLVTSKKIDHIS